MSAESTTTFSPLRGPEDPAVMQRVAQAKLALQSGGRNLQTCRQVRALIDGDLETSAVASVFFLENGIGACEMGGRPDDLLTASAFHYDRSHALEGLIRRGVGANYLEDYWREIEKTDKSTQYDERFALAAASWYAENEPTSAMGANSQQRLVTYWSRGCNAQTWKMDNDVNIVNLALNPLVVKKCKPDTAKAGRYFALYLSTGGSGVSPQRVGGALDLASYQASMYMRLKNYPRAAGWYAVVVRLGTANPGTYSTELAARNADDLFRRLYQPGLRWSLNGETLTVGDIVAGSVRQAQATARSQVSEAITNLATIQAAGYNVIEAY